MKNILSLRVLQPLSSIPYADLTADLVVEPHIQNDSVGGRRDIFAAHLDVASLSSGKPDVLSDRTVNKDLWQDDDGGERRRRIIGSLRSLDGVVFAIVE